MKRTILMISGALALAIITKADIVTEYRDHTEFSDGTSMQSHSTVVTRDETAERREAREAAKEARETALQNALAAHAAAEAKAKRQTEAWEKLIQDCKIQDLNNQIRDEAYYVSRGGPVLEGEGNPIPLWDQYDDSATIRIYLRDSGYTDLSDAQIAKVRSYMKAHQIKHVSQLGPIN